MEFNEYQAKAQATDRLPQRGGDGIVVPLLGIVGEAASLQTEYKKWLRDGGGHLFFRDHIREELGDILWYVANLAAKLDIELDEIAVTNLEKTRGRWLTAEHNGRWSFDDGFPEPERLPRQFVATISENPAHERFWQRARRRLGDGAGTRALVEVLLLHRHLPAAAVHAALDAVERLGAVDPALVAIEARRIADGRRETAVVERPALRRFERPAPSLAGRPVVQGDTQDRWRQRRRST